MRKKKEMMATTVLSGIWPTMYAIVIMNAISDAGHFGSPDERGTFRGTYFIAGHCG